MTTREAIAAARRGWKGGRGFSQGTGHAANGARQCVHSGRHTRGLSRDAHAGKSTRHGDGAGGGPSGDFAVGPERGAADRQSHPNFGLGAEPTNDGKVVARADAVADRRAPQRNREAPAQGAGESPHRGSQHPPRRQGNDRQAGEGEEDSARTNRNGRWTRWKRFRTRRPRRSRICPSPKREKFWSCARRPRFAVSSSFQFGKTKTQKPKSRSGLLSIMCYT